MARTSAIQHPKEEKFLMLRQSFISICRGNHCAAAILAIFEHWHNVKAGNAEQERIQAKIDPEHKPNLSTWFYKSYEELSDELFGLYGRMKICEALKLLHDLGFIQSRADQKNPYNRTRFYLLVSSAVNDALSKWTLDSPETDDGESENIPPQSENGLSHSPKLDDLTEITAEKTSEEKPSVCVSEGSGSLFSTERKESLRPTPCVPRRRPSGVPRDRFEEFWQRYPRKFGQDTAAREWILYVTADNEDQVFACLERYLASGEVRRGAVMNAGSTRDKLGWIALCAKDGWRSEWPKAPTSNRPQSFLERVINGERIAR